METIEELQVTTADITAQLPKIIAKGIEEARRPKLYMLQLFRENRQLVGKPGKELHVTVGGRMGYAIVGEGESLSSALSAQEKSLTDVTITPIKIGSWTQITKEAIKSAQIDLIDMHVETLTLDMAEGLNTYLYQTLVGTVSTTETIAGADTDTYDLSYGKILKVNSVKVDGDATTGYSVDYYDGKIKLASSVATGSSIEVSYIYTNRTYVLDASTAGKLSYSDIINARAKVIANRFTPNVMVVSPVLEADLLKTDQFIDVSKYGDREPILNGEIGKIAGLKVIPESTAYDVLVVTDAPKQGIVVWKQPLEILDKDDPDTYSIKIYAYELVGAETLFDEAVCIVVNTQHDAADL